LILYIGYMRGVRDRRVPIKKNYQQQFSSGDLRSHAVIQENALFRILLAVDCRPLFWKRRVWAKEAAEVPPRREKWAPSALSKRPKNRPADPVEAYRGGN
jgi:hypothetical protein